jgi:hypothetical protein
MPWGGIGALLGPIAGGLLSGGAATDAANIQAKAAQNATNVQLGEFQDISTKLAPFLNTGYEALGQYAALLGLGPNGQNTPSQLNTSPMAKLGAPPNPNDPALMAAFQSSPGYAFQKQQGIDAITSKFNPGSGAISGNMLKSLDTFGTGLANNDWWTNFGAVNNRYNTQLNQANTDNQNIANWLQNLTNVGSGAAAQQGAAGINMANQVGQNITGGGNALAAGQIGQATALTGGINSGIANLGGSSGINALLAQLFGGNPASQNSMEGFGVFSGANNPYYTTA